MGPPARALDTHHETTPSIITGNVQLNMTPPTRAMGTHLETTPSTLPGNKLKRS